ncbi:peptidyl-prolyl cis-trans isomerase CYP37, chloroplastic isoform X1 [Solanum pennellii]|uniref:Peptidyl-prolyl cis-trans isomerase CYP37, chloroplastic isoform X1 n=2 Tax=Solanum pennellii TaxID=28526 RepID=A0ABM1FT73_SOLPN|nr:peptidyl-prolyl cis-trans isomerase CYP37, chloroplastic isoform X1 [Solanum pennellii]XP_015061372.1 peptidyl-prolyl cis-trans isomerase CYP37, chloroplastic isoform X1 [Solanum pennellii]
MASPLSSSIFSPNFTHLYQNKAFFHSHLPLRSPIYATLNRIASKKNASMLLDGFSVMQELTKRPTAPSILSTHLESTVKQFQSLMAVIVIFTEVASPIPLYGLQDLSISPAEAVLYSPETKTLPRTGELALRRAIPANTNMKTIQDSLEDISYLLRIPQRKPFGTMEGNVKKALKIATDEKASILASIPAELKEEGSVLYTSLVDGKGGLQKLLQYIKDKDPDKVSVCLASTLDTIAQLELLQAPGLSFLLPQQYLKYPRLTGRGIVEFTVEKVDGSAFSPESAGEAKSTAKIQVVIDGFSAPLTAGNFAKLVVDGAYDGMKLTCANQAILSDSEVGKTTGYSVPLEIKPAGQFEPLYRTTLSIQDGELPVLPLSVYGAVAMAHSDVSDENSSPSQFFFYLYDKRNSGLGGLSFDEGQFSVFGYTTVGRDILPQIKTGDIIRSAKMVEGQDRLVLPPQDN